MGRFKILIFAVALFLALITDTEGQWLSPDIAPRPLCASQIALANYACGMLPYSIVVPPPPPPPPPSLPFFDNHESEGPRSSHSDQHGHQHRHQHADQHGHQHGHQQADQHGHHHHGHHHHGHQHSIPVSPLVQNCCKWVQQLDSVCICGLLSHLPAFLERPQHNFSLNVGGSCEATYSCGGGMKF